MTCFSFISRILRATSRIRLARRCAKRIEMLFSGELSTLHSRRTMAKENTEKILLRSHLSPFWCARYCGVWREIDNSINLCHLTSGSHASRFRFQPKTNLNSHSSCNKTFDCFISLSLLFFRRKSDFHRLNWFVGSSSRSAWTNIW